MDAHWKRKIVALLDGGRTMRIATNRPDGWPQTTAVGYANEGLAVYFLCGSHSQKAANLALDDRVSLAIDNDPDQVMRIKGLSMAAHACRIVDEAEIARVVALLISRYPAQEGPAMAPPPPGDVAVFRLVPKVVSVIDYSLGFAHSDLIVCDEAPPASR